MLESGPPWYVSKCYKLTVPASINVVGWPSLHIKTFNWSLLCCIIHVQYWYTVLFILPKLYALWPYCYMFNVVQFDKQFFIFIYFVIICYLLFVLLLHNMCLCITMYVFAHTHVHVHVQSRKACSVRQVVFEWEDFKVKWAMQFPPLHAALRAAPRAAYRDATATAKSAVGPGHAKRGATCSYKNGMQFCTPQLTPTALKQHREQSIWPVPTSDSDYSDIYQWIVIYKKW